MPNNLHVNAMVTLHFSRNELISNTCSKYFKSYLTNFIQTEPFYCVSSFAMQLRNWYYPFNNKKKKVIFIIFTP